MPGRPAAEVRDAVGRNSATAAASNGTTRATCVVAPRTASDDCGTTRRILVQRRVHDDPAQPQCPRHGEGIVDAGDLGERRAADEVLQRRPVAAVAVHDAVAVCERAIQVAGRRRRCRRRAVRAAAPAVACAATRTRAASAVISAVGNASTGSGPPYPSHAITTAATTASTVRARGRSTRGENGEADTRQARRARGEPPSPSAPAPAGRPSRGPPQLIQAYGPGNGNCQPNAAGRGPRDNTSARTENEQVQASAGGERSRRSRGRRRTAVAARVPTSRPDREQHDDQPGEQLLLVAADRQQMPPRPHALADVGVRRQVRLKTAGCRPACASAPAHAARARRPTRRARAPRGWRSRCSQPAAAAERCRSGVRHRPCTTTTATGIARK